MIWPLVGGPAVSIEKPNRIFAVPIHIHFESHRFGGVWKIESEHFCFDATRRAINQFPCCKSEIRRLKIMRIANASMNRNINEKYHRTLHFGFACCNCSEFASKRRCDRHLLCFDLYALCMHENYFKISKRTRALCSCVLATNKYIYLANVVCQMWRV